ncbi:MAG TPA: SGNH/GDSL hydrolase family protein [Alphaproteobacteria bacterium]|nr:SGNH/GDSL hydrolase family protein [Alphaproteobacteria bacterium]
MVRRLLLVTLPIALAATLSAIALAVRAADEAAAAPDAACAAPPALMALGQPLAHGVEALEARRSLKVVAIGSSSTEGTGASGPAAAYPAQLERMLSARYPGATVAILNKGIGGETAARNLARFERDVLAHKPDLVIWQVGTNDSFQNVAPEAFRAVVRDGVAKLRAQGAEALLMEPQFFPKEAGVAAYPAMIAAVRELGAELGVPVLRRHAIMRHWIDSGQFDAARMLSPDGLHMTDASYRCLAQVVADALAAAKAAPSS